MNLLSPWWEAPGVLSLVLVFLVFGAAGFFHGLTGFGYALLVMSTLTGLVGFESIRDVVALMNPVVCLGAFLPHWKSYRFRLGRGMILGACLGAPIGFFLLDTLDEAMARRIFGGFLVAIALAEWWLSRGKGSGLPEWSGLPCGLLGGGFGGAFNIGGPPLVAYCYARPWTKAETVATIQVAFLLSAIIRVILMGGSGKIDPDLLRASAVLALPTLLMIWLGGRFLGKIDRGVLRIVAFSFVFVLGVKYLFVG